MGEELARYDSACEELKRKEQAPDNNLPTWGECKLRVDNSEFIAKRVNEGGHGNDDNSPQASALHRFIYEYDDANPYRSRWFLHRLEQVIEEIQRSIAEAVRVE